MFGKEITGHSQVEPRNSLVSLLIEKNFGQKSFPKFAGYYAKFNGHCWLGTG